MNILFTTAHPAQIHNFRLLKTELESNGHRVFWMATEKDISKYLLIHYKIDYVLLKRPGKRLLAKIRVLISNTHKAVNYLRRNKIDMIISRVSPYLSLAGFFLRIPHFALADTESSGIYNKLFTQFVCAIITAKSFKLTLRSDQIRFDGNIELFYLHPKRFTPAKDVHRLLDIEEGTPYVVMRFVSWDSYHDTGLTGFYDENKIMAAQKFSKYARVFITSEVELPASLEEFRIKIPPEKMHDVLAGATLFFGESATMASESAVLGTHSIYLDNLGRGYTDEEGEYCLVFNFKNSKEEQLKAINKGIELLNNSSLAYEMNERLATFMSSKIDVTAFMLWFIENYPKSYRIMQENPDYQYNFK